jgi:heme exporter protein D
VTSRQALALAVVVLAAPATANAAPRTGEEVRGLAQRAANNSAALEELRRVDVVDGRRVDLGAALAGARGDALRARLAVLAEGGELVDSQGAPREDAARILSERRFHESDVPRPFHGLLEWIRDEFGFVARPFEWLADRVPGGSFTMWFLLAASAIALAVLVARRTVQRRAGRALVLARERRHARVTDPRELEREADEAVRRGDHTAAVRLRFRAGLLRLGRKEVIPLRESLTSGQVRRLVRLQEFDRLARDHDEIAYGARVASMDDADAARAGWRVVVAKAVPR